MATLARPYGVSAGRDFLRFFSSYTEAMKYARALMLESDPSIGAVRVELWSDDDGAFHTRATLGTPKGAILCNP